VHPAEWRAGHWEFYDVEPSVLISACRQHNLWLSLGGFQEKGPPLPPAKEELLARPTPALAPDGLPLDVASQTCPEPNAQLLQRLYNAHVVS